MVRSYIAHKQCHQVANVVNSTLLGQLLKRLIVIAAILLNFFTLRSVSLFTWNQLRNQLTSGSNICFGPDLIYESKLVICHLKILNVAEKNIQ